MSPMLSLTKTKMVSKSLTRSELRAGRTVYKLWHQASELKCMAYEFNRELSRLSHAMGQDGVVPVTPCPF